jgi:hypothetical protein
MIARTKIGNRLPAADEPLPMPLETASQALIREFFTYAYTQVLAADWEQFFHPLNRSQWMIEFAAWLDVKAREHASND